jgi:DNA-binding MarR family transcriptional regulator
MLNKEYIDRVPDPEDGRQARLTISASGRELHNKVMERFRTRETQGFQILDDDDRAALDRILQKLALHVAVDLD